MQMWTKKDKNGEPHWWWFEKSLSDVSGSESDNDSNDKKDNDESNKYTSFFYKQSIFDPRLENCLSFFKKLPQNIV